MLIWNQSIVITVGGIFPPPFFFFHSSTNGNQTQLETGICLVVSQWLSLNQKLQHSLLQDNLQHNTKHPFGYYLDQRFCTISGKSTTIHCFHCCFKDWLIPTHFTLSPRYLVTPLLLNMKTAGKSSASPPSADFMHCHLGRQTGKMWSSSHEGWLVLVHNSL